MKQYCTSKFSVNVHKAKRDKEIYMNIQRASACLATVADSSGMLPSRAILLTSFIVLVFIVSLCLREVIPLLKWCTLETLQIIESSVG